MKKYLYDYGKENKRIHTTKNISKRTLIKESNGSKRVDIYEIKEYEDNGKYLFSIGIN